MAPLLNPNSLLTARLVKHDLPPFLSFYFIAFFNFVCRLGVRLDFSRYGELVSVPVRLAYLLFISFREHFVHLD